jgi:UDP-N-acetyl-D-mannosaminuronate dehydrogenase
VALRAAESGLKVYGLDANEGTVRDLNAGRSHVDDVTDEELQSALAHGFQASVDPSWSATSSACRPLSLVTVGRT